MITEKICTRCHQSLPLSEFHKWKYGSNGLKSVCKICNTERSIQYQKTEIGRTNHLKNSTRYERTKKGKENKRRYNQTDKGKEAARKAGLNDQEKHPFRKKSRDMLNNALKSGKIVKASICQKCGDSGKIHGHHMNYEKPLEVLWLCQWCHDEEHGKHDWVVAELDK